MSRKTKPRLGKGLSGLIGEPVQVYAPEREESSQLVRTPEPSRAPAEPAAEQPISPADSRFRMIATGDIDPNRFQPRRDMDEATLARLAASIHTSGVMQPVAVRPGVEAGRWELIAGERRWRAATLAGLTEIPALVAEIDDQEAAEWAIVENVQREDLNPVDRALAYCRLVVDFDMTHGEIADRAGVDRSTVANLIRLTELEQELLDLLAAGHLQVGHAKVLLSMPRGIRRVTLGKTAAAISMSVRQLEDEVEKVMSQEGPTTVGGLSSGVVEPKKEKAAGAHSALERQLADHLGTKVRIRHQQRTGRGKVTIEYYDLEHFDALMSMLGFRYDS